MGERPELLHVELHGEVIAHLRERKRQGRVELTYTDNACQRWEARPAGGPPSRHILKPDPPTHPCVVVREAEALLLARQAGLTTIESRLLDVGGRPCLIVDRYDRVTTTDGAIQRVHQEDVLQAVGRDPVDQRGRVKYQERGGPGFRDVAALLLERARDPDAELHKLAGAMVFTVMIGNADAHAKNLSLLLDPPGTVRLAPLYDTMPTMLFGRLKVRCAMWVGGVHHSLAAVTREAMVQEIAGRRAWKVPERRAADVVDEWVHTIASIADDNTPTGRYVARRAVELRRGR